MSVFFNGSIVFKIRAEEVSCFYFCRHFNKSFLKKQPVTQVSFLRNQKSNEIITYSQKYRKEIRSILLFMSPLSNCFLKEAKKFLIPYIPVVKYGGEMFVFLQCVESSY